MSPPKRSPYAYAIPVGVVVLGMGYLALTGVYGEYGMIRLLKAQSEAEEREAEIRLLGAEQAELERDIRALSPDSLDPDMLEERLRAVLGWSHPDDLLLTPGLVEERSPWTPEPAEAAPSAPVPRVAPGR